MKIFKKLIYVFFLLLFLLFFLGPIFWTFLISITPDSSILEKSGNFLPSSYNFNNYLKLFDFRTSKGKLLYLGIKNSLKACLITFLICLPMAFFSAFALERLRFKGRDFIKNSLLITIAIPVMATIIPIYKMFLSFKLLNNIFALCLVYVTAFLPVSVWLAMGYFSNIPKELDEAAKVDGASIYNIFFSVILPLSKPILATVSLIIFLSTWSQFQIPLIIASNIDTKPIAIVSSEFITKDSVNYGMTAATGILAILPPSLVAIFFRRFLVSGMMKGSGK